MALAEATHRVRAPGGVAPRWRTVAIIAVAAAFSLGMGFYQLLGLGELHGAMGYDDGVWFGSAVRMANGVLPYRSFVMDQPPGVPVLMLPFGLLSRVTGTREAFGFARLVVPFVAAGAVIAVGWLLRHRGRVAVAVGCGALAIYPEALVNDRTVMIEPFCALFCLLGLVGVFDGDHLSDRRRRLVLAGVAFGLAGACKAFAVLPFAVVVVAILVAPGRLRRLPPVIAGAAVGFFAVCGPFLVLAPTQFLHQVVAVQLGRSQKVEPVVWDRLFSLLGLLPATGLDKGYGNDSHLADAALVALFAALVLGGWAVALTTRGAHPPPPVTMLDAVALAVVVVTAVGLIQPPAYYTHYSAFFAPFLAVTFGLAAGHLALRLPAVVAVVAAVALVAGAVHAVRYVDASRVSSYDAAYLDRLIPPGACVLGDNVPSLLLADRFTSRVSGCAQMVDAFGTTISADGGFAARSPQAEHSRAVAVWEQLFSQSHYVVLNLGYYKVRIPWGSSALRSYAQRHFDVLSIRGSTRVLIRRPASPRRAAAPAHPRRHPS